MSNSFNPYQAWLGFAAEVTQPNYFELLGLDEAEDDAKTIASAADRAASQVRRHRPGDQAEQWAALLDEIAAAKKCLTDPQSRSEYRRLKAGNKAADRQRAAALISAVQKSTGTQRVDPNMYPPGAAPVGPSRSPSTDARSKAASYTLPIPETPDFSEPDPQSPLGLLPQPIAAPLELPLSPAGFPYLRPADPTSLADPMRPATLSASPSDPPVFGFGTVMAPASQNSDPMAAIPIATPAIAVTLPIAQAIPANSYGAFLAGVPAAAAGPQVESPPDASRISVAASPAAAERSGTKTLGPALIGVGVGLVLLVVIGGAVSWNAYQNAQALAGADQNTTTTELSGDATTTAAKSASHNQIAAPSPNDPSKGEPVQPEMADKTDSPTQRIAISEPPVVVPEPTAAPATNPAETPKPEPKPKPESPPVPAPNPVPTTTTTPTPNPTPDPAKPDEIPKPTKEELVKLGRAMQKTRDAIAARDFDKAAALIEIASELPKLPEQQAMLDRLKLLLDSVSQYQAAILTSISKLQVGSSFEIGEATVGVVDVRPDKLTLRTNGQNRTYMITELPIGLAAELAAQTLADDPTTLALKGAYVLASPRASEAELKKAREFLVTASGSVEPAKDLLLLLDDKYDLAPKPEK